MKNFKANKQSILSLLLASTIAMTSMAGCTKKKNLSFDNLPTETIKTLQVKGENGEEHSSMLNYFEQFNIVEKAELQDSVNEKIDDFLLDLKNKGIDLSEIDGDVLRQYVFAPYILYEGEKNHLCDEYTPGLAILEFNLIDEGGLIKSIIISKDSHDESTYYGFYEYYHDEDSAVCLMSDYGFYVNEEIKTKPPGFYLNIRPTLDQMSQKEKSYYLRINGNDGENIQVSYKNDDNQFIKENASTEKRKQLFDFLVSNMEQIKEYDGNYEFLFELIELLSDNYSNLVQKSNQKIKSR